MRGQTELPALGIALLLLTGVVVLGVSLADGAFTSAQREPVQRQTATSLSEQLIAPESPLTSRQNVLKAGAISSLDSKFLRETSDIRPETDVRIQLDGNTVVTAGQRIEGTTIERVVLVERRTVRTLDPDFDSSRTVTLPRRTSNVRLTIAPQNGTRVRSVVVNGQTLLYNTSGLTGTFEIEPTQLETVTLLFRAVGPLTSDSVTIEYTTVQTRKAILGVTVDA